eukprot:3859323-Pleurochrysis_carterae.AAC.3
MFDRLRALAYEGRPLVPAIRSLAVTGLAAQNDHPSSETEKAGGERKLVACEDKVIQAACTIAASREWYQQACTQVRRGKIH